MNESNGYFKSLAITKNMSKHGNDLSIIMITMLYLTMKMKMKSNKQKEPSTAKYEIICNKIWLFYASLPLFFSKSPIKCNISQTLQAIIQKNDRNHTVSTKKKHNQETKRYQTTQTCVFLVYLPLKEVKSHRTMLYCCFYDDRSCCCLMIFIL